MTVTLEEILRTKGKEILSCAPECPVQDAAMKMSENQVGALMVRLDNCFGIITERDLLRRVLAQGLSPEKLTVGEVMTKDLVTVGPELLVQEAMQVVTEKRIRHLPVMQGGELVGVVSSGDLTKWVIKNQTTEIKDLVDFVQGKYPN